MFCQEDPLDTIKSEEVTEKTKDFQAIAEEPKEEFIDEVKDDERIPKEDKTEKDVAAETESEQNDSDSDYEVSLLSEISLNIGIQFSFIQTIILIIS